MNRINWTELKPQIQQVGRLSLPAILTQITTIAMQYIDSAMVGALGANASAAIGLVSSTTWLLSGTIYAVSAGFSVQVAHQIGGNHDKKARDVVRHGIASALVVSAVLCLIGLLISHPLPGWLGGAQKIRRNATLYFMMFAIMLPFSQLNSLMSSFLQCSGDMVTPSILNAVMCVLDVIFNALLIPVFGVMGAGMGTMLACAVISLTGAWFCCVRNPQLRLRRKEKTVFDAKILKTAFKIGVPVAVQEIAMNSAMVADTMLIAPLHCDCGQFVRRHRRRPLLHARLRHRFRRDNARRQKLRRRKLQAGETLRKYLHCHGRSPDGHHWRSDDDLLSVRL